RTKITMYEIYGAPGCSYCERAKMLLEHYEAEYTYIDVSKDPNVQAAFFTKFPNTNRVPQIMYDGKDRGYPIHIGGYTELETWFKEYTKYKAHLKYTQGVDIGPKT
ncbi:MAG: glutaredoxin, partial [Anaerolineales bacterium]|nr:glutaredoxin [Anaerolineales bacterium]